MPLRLQATDLDVPLPAHQADGPGDAVGPGPFVCRVRSPSLGPRRIEARICRQRLSRVAGSVGCWNLWTRHKRACGIRRIRGQQLCCQFAARCFGAPNHQNGHSEKDNHRQVPCHDLHPPSIVTAHRFPRAKAKSLKDIQPIIRVPLIASNRCRANSALYPSRLVHAIIGYGEVIQQTREKVIQWGV